MDSQRTKKSFVAHGCGFPPGQYHNIKINTVSTKPASETLPDNALYPVTAHRTFVYLARYRHAQSRAVSLVFSGEDLEAVVRRDKRFLKNLFKFNSFIKFILSGKRSFVERIYPRTNRRRTRHLLMRLLRIKRQAERRFLPFARRALMIACPAWVDMRARKPCLRARLRRLGWNVRFISCSPSNLFHVPAYN